MSRSDEIKKLITNYNRRLQKLKEQKALQGISVDPKIPLEIEDIEAEITELEDELHIISDPGGAAARSNERSHTLLFDESHGQGKWRFTPPIVSRGYKRIVEITKGCNLDVDILSKGETISLNKLRKYAAFVLPIGPQGLCRLNEKELKAICDYVNEGRGLLMLSTYTGDWHHEANLNKIAENYGFTFNNDVVLQRHAADGDPWGHIYDCSPSSKYVVIAQSLDGSRSELLDGVQQVKTLSSCSLDIIKPDAASELLLSESESVLFQPEPSGRGIAIDHYKRKGTGSVALVAVSKSAKVVVVGSWKMLLDEFVDEPGFDNGQLYTNIMVWLTK